MPQIVTPNGPLGVDLLVDANPCTQAVGRLTRGAITHLDQRVEYQVGRGESGIGHVIAIDEDSEQITVRDEDDGSIWTGSMDHAQACSDSDWS